MANNYRLEINRIFRAPKYTEGDNNLTDAVTRVYYSWVAESEEGIIKKIQYTRDLNPSNDGFIEFSKLEEGHIKSWINFDDERTSAISILDDQILSEQNKFVDTPFPWNEISEPNKDI
jgi:hypothetical protein